MTIAPIFQRLFATIALILMAPALASALSVYDVIQLSQKNYSDQDIVSLIQATNSAFALNAEDIVRLNQMGISEPVIQAMLEAIPDVTAANPPAGYPPPPPVTENNPDHTEHTQTNSSHTSSTTVIVAPTNHTAEGLFGFEPYGEAGSGHHHHNAVNLAGVQLFILRNEGGFPTVAERSSTIVKRLEKAAAAGTGTFRPNPETTSDSVMFYGRDSDVPVTILNVSQSDAIAYQRRSGRAVTPAVLAAYWSDLLSDYWSIVINQSAPERLSDLHEGEVLQSLYEQWEISSVTESAKLEDAVQLLPRQQQQHLRRLAITVPHDFKISDIHLARQP